MLPGPGIYWQRLCFCKNKKQQQQQQQQQQNKNKKQQKPAFHLQGDNGARVNLIKALKHTLAASCSFKATMWLQHAYSA